MTLVAAVSSAPADAATVSPFEFQAAPGEVNHVTVTGAPGSSVDVTDSGALLTPLDGCTALSAHSVRCPSFWGQVNLGDGDDTATGAPNLHGGDGNDDLTGASAWGEGGNDVIHAGYGDGGEGDDTLGPDRAFVNLMGGPGNDALDGTGDNDTLDGGPGDDVVRGHGGTYDHLSGGDGRDTLIAGSSPNEYGSPYPTRALDGGDGPDSLQGGDLPERLDGGPGDDAVDGRGGNDFLLGGDGADTLAAGDGDDTLDGGADADRLDGGAGIDKLAGGTGADWIAGGADRDYLDYSGATNTTAGPVGYTTARIVVDLTKPGGDGAPGENDFVQPDVEAFSLGGANDYFRGARGGRYDVNGGPGNDTLVGGPAADRLDGGLGNDKLLGRGGDDQIEGGRDAFWVNGKPVAAHGNDTLSGGSGNDVLDGGKGDDVFRGGAGRDAIDAADFSAVNMSPLIPLAGGDRVGCGAARDRVFADYYDEVAPDCELTDPRTPGWRAARPSRGLLTLKARCVWERDAPCRGRARLVWLPRRVGAALAYSGRYTRLLKWYGPDGCVPARRSTQLASGRFRIRAGRVNRVTLQIPARTRRIIARRHCLLVRAEFRFREPHAGSHLMTRTLALRATR